MKFRLFETLYNKLEDIATGLFSGKRRRREVTKQQHNQQYYLSDTSKRMLPGPSTNHGERLVLLASKNSGKPLIRIHQPAPPPHQSRKCQFLLKLFLVVFLCGLLIRVLVSFERIRRSSSSSSSTTNNDAAALQGLVDGVLIPPPDLYICDVPPCFLPSKLRVPTGDRYFPSFWDFAHMGPIDVGYDKRALKLNGHRSFFLGGSMHPSRATPKTWNFALDEAVQHGLNLITIYVMWAAHQPVPGKEIDWSFPDSSGVECDGFGVGGGGPPSASSSDQTNINNNDGCSNDWTLASAIREAANRGLFVHLRIGPYDCAEYNYGGIPEWLPLHKPNMAMRRPNRDWLDAMEDFVSKMVAYVKEEQLWAYQGGNIIMAQIENELGGDMDYSKEHILLVDTTTGKFVDPKDKNKVPSDHVLRNATLQDYADWSGDLANRLEPNVTWTMCNGLSANNTIHTSNCNNGDGWLENYGGTGRIQKDQPAILTEFEGGFQVWGEDPHHPDDYFWGRTARDMAVNALRWFARGGTHLNYYMFWGGYNRARSAAAGITNWYASDVQLCPSGQRRQPKFGHFQSMHSLLTAISPTLLTADTALKKDKPIPFLNKDGIWETGDHQRIFEYKADNNDSEGFPHVIFVENDNGNDTIKVKVPLDEDGNTKILKINPHSTIVLVDGMIGFDSSFIDPRAMSFKREFADQVFVPKLLDWSSYEETIGVDSGDAMAWSQDHPIEQTELNVYSRVYSDYAWYETEFTVDSTEDSFTLFIETQEANAFVAYVDKGYVGANDRHYKKEGPFTLSIDLGLFDEAGVHKLSLLSESLGYINLIGRWGGGTDAKVKGITGDVILSSSNTGNTSLVDGRIWRSFPGLHGEQCFNRPGSMTRADLQKSLRPAGNTLSPTWYSALFDSPGYDPSRQALFLKLTSGRGHLFLNGRDLGRFWNITRHNSPSTYSQEYYLLPDDFFYTDGSLNEIILFDSVGGAAASAELVLSWIESTPEPNFQDEIDYPFECI